MANKRVISTEIDLANQLSGRDVDTKLNKYITDIDGGGITIHPEHWENESTFVRIDGSGMDIVDKNGVTVGSYGTDVQIGKDKEQHLSIQSNSSVWYDEGGEPIAEISQGNYGIDQFEELMDEVIDFGAYGDSTTPITSYELILPHKPAEESSSQETITLGLLGNLNTNPISILPNVYIPTNGEEIIEGDFKFKYYSEVNDEGKEEYKILITHTGSSGYETISESQESTRLPAIILDFIPRLGDTITTVVKSEGLTDVLVNLTSGISTIQFIDEARGWLDYNGEDEIRLIKGLSESNGLFVTYSYPWPYFNSEWLEYRINKQLPFYTFGTRNSESSFPGDYSFTSGTYNWAGERCATVFGNYNRNEMENSVVIGEFNDNIDIHYDPLTTTETSITKSPSFPIELLVEEVDPSDIYITLSEDGEAPISFPATGTLTNSINTYAWFTIGFVWKNSLEDKYTNFTTDLLDMRAGENEFYGEIFEIIADSPSSRNVTVQALNSQALKPYPVILGATVSSYNATTEITKEEFEIRESLDPVEVTGDDEGVEITYDAHKTFVNVLPAVWQGKLSRIDSCKIEYSYVVNEYTSYTVPFLVGNGYDLNNRQNAFAVDWDGDIHMTLNTALPTNEELINSLTTLGWNEDCITDSSMLKLKEWISKINNSLLPIEIPLTFSQCTNGAYTRCYRIGNVVYFSWNINITTATTTNYDYVSGLPIPIGGGWACSATPTGSVNTTRWWITGKGTLSTDGATVAGWQNGNVTYICEPDDGGDE